MWRFQRSRKRVPWSSCETSGFCVSAPTEWSHTQKTGSSRKPGSSKEMFIVKHIRHLSAGYTVRSYTLSCPLRSLSLSTVSVSVQQVHGTPPILLLLLNLWSTASSAHLLYTHVLLLSPHRLCYCEALTGTVRYLTVHNCYQTHISNPTSSSLHTHDVLWSGCKKQLVLFSLTQRLHS